MSVEDEIRTALLTERKPRIKLRDALLRVECSIIRAALAAANDNQSEAARRLGISRGRVVHRMNTYGEVGVDVPAPSLVFVEVAHEQLAPPVFTAILDEAKARIRSRQGA